MCGVAGIIDTRGTLDPSDIKDMTDAIKHRGPDAEGFFFANDNHLKCCNRFEAPNFHPSCMLGHRRLAIIDLDGGDQPMTNEDRSMWVTYNGEIYNHAELRCRLEQLGHLFRSHHSDTEVILHAYEEWGVKGIDRLNGIFAFGIVDLTQGRVILARDHYGVKPLYYTLDESRFVFSSEVKAIVACDSASRNLDRTALDHFLSFRYVPSPLTAFDGIYKVEAGGYVVFDAKAKKIETGTFTSAQTAINDERTFPQWVQGYQQLFEQAVKRQLLSDVEVGALLSGGIDSSAICAIAAQHSKQPLRTYTVGFKDFPEGNELEEAKAYAKHLGTKHTDVMIDTSDFISVLEEVAWFMDEPTATSSVVPLYYLTKEITKEIKVVLSGQGADEPLAGYSRYCGERLYQLGFKHLAFLHPFVEKLPRQEKLKRAFRSFKHHDGFERFMSVYWLFNPTQKKFLLKDHFPQQDPLLLKKLYNSYPATDQLGRMLYMDSRAWLPDDLLTYGDKSTMINAIEARVPILDRDLMTYIESMPSKYKLSARLQGKLVHRKACQKWLPPFVLNRRKKGFLTPLDRWFRNELEGYVRDQLLSGRVSRRLFNRKAVEAMIKSHQNGKQKFDRHLFALLMLEKWAERYNINV